MFTWYDLIPKHNHDCTYVDQRSSNHIEHTREDWNIKITINLNMPTRRVRVGLQIAFKIRTPGPSRDHNDVDVARSLLCVWHSTCSVWLCTSMLSCLSHSSRQPWLSRESPVRRRLDRALWQLYQILHANYFVDCNNLQERTNVSISKTLFEKSPQRMTRESTIASATVQRKKRTPPTLNFMFVHFAHQSRNKRKKERQSLNLVCMSVFCVIRVDTRLAK